MATHDSTRPDNPFAFARPYKPEQNGMTLRDYFAAKAMHAELATAGAFDGPAEALAEAAEKAGQTIEERIAFNAYRLADAMLKARSEAQ